MGTMDHRPEDMKNVSDGSEKGWLDRQRDRVDRLSKRFKFDSHHQIERFGVTVLVLVVALTVVVSSAFVTSSVKKSAELNDVAIYTPTFTSSKTGASGKVDGLFVSPDKRKAMLLMNFDNPSLVSTNAKNYQSFLTATTKDLKSQDLKAPIVGQIVSFGSTGYVGIELSSGSSAGFPKQILQLTMRANSRIVSPEQAAVDAPEQPSASDSSFTKHDQWALAFNPGANGTTTIDSLGNDSASMKDLFYDMVIKQLETKQRETLTGDLQTLASDQAAIREYMQRVKGQSLDGARLQIPALSKQIDQDSIVCDDGTVIGKITSSTDDGVNTRKPCDPSQMNLVSNWTYPNGYAFDWKSKNVNTGYLDEIVPKGQSYVDYMSDRAAKTVTDDRLDATSWKLTNGRTLASYTASGDSLGPVKDMNDSVGLLMAAIDKYKSDKQTYEVSDLSKLLDLEVRLRDVEANHTINSDSSAVRIY